MIDTDLIFDTILANLELIATLASVLVGGIALIAGWMRWRATELRREEVLAWANEAITAMQSLTLIVQRGRLHITAAEERTRLAQLMFDTSVLVERGRLFFRNARSRRGSDKHHAYRGSRPEILDQLVLAHQIACTWPKAPADARARMKLVAQDATRRFVSLVQMEVGRVRTAARDTRRGGRGADLDARLAEIEPWRLEPDAA